MNARECLLCGSAWQGEGPPETACPRCGDHAVRIVQPRVSRRTVLIGAAVAGGVLFLALSALWVALVVREASGPVQTPHGLGERVTVSGKLSARVPGLVLVAENEFSVTPCYLARDARVPPHMPEGRRVSLRGVRLTEGPERGKVVEATVTYP